MDAKEGVTAGHEGRGGREENNNNFNGAPIIVVPLASSACLAVQLSCAFLRGPGVLRGEALQGLGSELQAREVRVQPVGVQ